MSITYNQNTLNTLGEILAPDCPKRYQMIFTDMLKSSIVPWAQKEQKLTKETLRQCVTKAVEESFLPYSGSVQGAHHFDEQRKLLYCILWGNLVGDSLMNRDFESEKVTCSYDESSGKFLISLLPDGRKIAYSRRQLEWCQKQMPRDYEPDKTDDDIIKIMYPAWKEFGNFNTSLPEEIPITKEQKAYIQMLFEQEREDEV